MNEILDEVEGPLSFSDREIFTEIWTRPRKVFKYLEDNEYDKYVYSLLILAGIVRAFDRASLKGMGDDLPLIAVLGFCIVLGGMLGWLSYYVYAALLSWTGKWLGGEADTWSILRMLAHAMIPYTITLFFLLAQVAYFGNEIFKSAIDLSNGGAASEIVFYGLVLIELTFAICSLIFIVIGLSEIQQINIGKAILNLFLPVLVIIVPIVLMILIYRMF